MKKKLFFALLVMLFPFMVNAENITVTNFDEVKANNVAGNSLEFTGTTLKLTEDINLVAILKINSNTVLELNGHELKLSGHSNYGVIVYKQLTIEGDGNVLISDNFGIATSMSGSPKVIVNGGTFNQTGGYYMFGLFDGEMIFNDGTFTAVYCVANNFAGSYDGVNGKLTINGGKFNTSEEYGAPIMNSDVLEINDGEFVSAGVEGNAIYTNSDGNTTIKGGTFKTTGSDAATVYNEGTTIVEDGSFESTNGDTLYNEDGASLKLVGGSYSDSANSVAPFVDEDSAQYTNSQGDAVVVPRENLVVKTFSVAVDASEADLVLIKQEMSDGFQLGKTFDVTAWLVNPNDNNAKVEQVTETTEEVEVILDVSDLPDVAEGMTREFEVIKIHNGVAEGLQADDNENGTISVESSEFSTYAVTYRDVSNTQNREDSDDETTPTTGGNPETGDTILLYILMLMVGLTGIVVTSKKLAKN